MQAVRTCEGSRTEMSAQRPAMERRVANVTVFSLPIRSERNAEAWPRCCRYPKNGEDRCAEHLLEPDIIQIFHLMGHDEVNPYAPIKEVSQHQDP